MIKYYKVRMINNDIGNCKLDMPLPKGYYFVNYRDNNDQLVWADIEMAAGEFSTVDKLWRNLRENLAIIRRNCNPDAIFCIVLTGNLSALQQAGLIICLTGKNMADCTMLPLNLNIRENIWQNLWWQWL